jgi:LytS/YehU family sensor histidine kinase
MSAQQGCGTGFANVRLRLLMRYGDAAVLSLTDAAPHGVVAAVSLPIEEAA